MVSEAPAYAGGIWVLWNNFELQLENITIDDQIVNCFVRCRGGPSWLLSAIYASSKPMLRLDLWRYIEQLGEAVLIPWLLMGYFNQILSLSEKKGGNRPLCSGV